MKSFHKNFSILTAALLFSLTASGAACAAAGTVQTNEKNTSAAQPAPANDQTAVKPESNNASDRRANSAAPTANLPTETKEFSQATGAGTSELGNFAKWNFTFGADQFEIDEKGVGKRQAGGKSDDFRLPMRNMEMLDNNVYFAEYKGDLLILYGISDFESGASMIVRLDGKTLKEKWAADAGSFNAAKGLIENNFVYLGASGFVGKIDLDSGKYLWKHDDLYRKYRKDGAFNIMEVPVLDGATVVYTEKLENRPANEIVFDKQSGKFVRTNVK